MKFEIIGGCNFDGDALCEPYYKIKVSYKKQTKLLKIGCSAWEHYKPDCINHLKKYWPAIKSISEEI